MKVVFEYEDGTYRIVPKLKYGTIEERTETNMLINEYIMDNHVNKYIIADNNHIGGFEGHKDLLELTENLKQVERNLRYIREAVLYYKDLEGEM